MYFVTSIGVLAAVAAGQAASSVADPNGAGIVDEILNTEQLKEDLLSDDSASADTINSNTTSSTVSSAASTTDSSSYEYAYNNNFLKKKVEEEEPIIQCGECLAGTQGPCRSRMKLCFPFENAKTRSCPPTSESCEVLEAEERQKENQKKLQSKPAAYRFTSPDSNLGMLMELAEDVASWFWPSGEDMQMAVQEQHYDQVHYGGIGAGSLGSSGWYSAAAAKGHPDANYVMGQQALGFDPFQDPFDWKGNIKVTATTLQSPSFAGQPRRNYVEAEKYLKQAVVSGHTDAMALYGIMLLRGLGLVQDKPKGLDLLRRAVLDGNANAAAGLGEYYYRMRDAQLALPMLELAADAGHPRGMAVLGDLLQNSAHIHEDDKELANHRGLVWLKKAADAGDAWASNSLGVVIWDGVYPSFTEHRDTITAAKYFQKSAEKNWAGGQVNFGLANLERAVENPDFPLAAELFTDAANQGSIEGFLNLGIQQLRGQGIKQDRVSAAQNFVVVADYAKQSLRAGSEAYLGALYAEGKSGITQDFKEAHYWFSLADEDLPDPEFQMIIGCFHLAGLGVKQNPVLAREWLERSANGGNVHGKKAFRALQNGANVDHRSGLAFLEHLRVCEPITAHQLFEPESVSPKGVPLFDPLFPARGEEFLQRALDEAELMERDALAYHLAGLQTEKFSNSVKGKMQKPTRAPIRVLYNQGTLISDTEDLVQLTDRMPQKDPSWFSSVRGRRADDPKVQVIYI